jgi:(S)-2-hydroxy-acid oxidase
MEYLSEVSKLANEKVPTPFESGICRGSNVFTAMSLGASAVYVGRP